MKVEKLKGGKVERSKAGRKPTITLDDIHEDVATWDSQGDEVSASLRKNLRREDSRELSTSLRRLKSLTRKPSSPKSPRQTHSGIQSKPSTGLASSAISTRHSAIGSVEAAFLRLHKAQSSLPDSSKAKRVSSRERGHA